MTQYIQHKWANTIHIARDTWASGEIKTYCGKRYWPNTTFTPDLRGEREEDVVCCECRRKAAAAAGKRVYSQPTLRRWLPKAKRALLRKAHQAHTERQRLAAWNAAAQERTP
jgi:hypothetical protein